MHTLGVDLAAQSNATYACRLAWEPGRVRVESLVGGLDDAGLHAALASDDLASIGVDVPFGWPDAFVSLLANAGAFNSWQEDARRLRMRETDKRCHDVTGIWPMSVSSDRLAVPAMRWRIFRARFDLDSARLHEVYPAAALSIWKLPCRAYKQAAQRPEREKILARIETAIALETDATQRATLLDTADALDALVASLVARAIAVNAIEPVDAGVRSAAAREGWIELPRGTLDALNAEASRSA